MALNSKLLSLAPWLVAWSGEAEASVRPCPYSGGRQAVSSVTSPGDGLPIFTKLHPVRLRAAIAEGRCGICGELAQLPDRWMLNRGDWAIVRGELRFVLRDFLVHGGCADFALERCPWLRTNRPRLVRAPNHFRLVATARGASASNLVGGDFLESFTGPVVDRLWLTMAPGDALKRFGRLITAPTGLTREERRRLRRI